ncbi:MAG: glycosyltransferase [Candidatus Hodarchaeales archaeon]
MPTEGKKKYSISLCTTCMNRLDELSQTLPKNIEDNIDYPRIEFVVLDYNSTKDNVGQWIKDHMMEYIKAGKLTYLRTDEPQSYSMSNSRNIAFRAANGYIVNNVDGDNFVKPGFAEYLNKLAYQKPEQALFAKGRRMVRGRVGFYKKEFVDWLGGYDETNLTGYGHDDHDIMHRAYGLGFKLMYFGGKFYEGVPSKKHQTDNFTEKNWRYTEKRNKLISYFNLTYKIYKANKGVHWGKARLIKNFNEEIIL